tara:strand:- start:53388 stop:53543 length:156 start_codon:yes stop_codon:yes gene_type:complete
MKTKKNKTLKEIIKVKIDNNIVFNVKSISDFKFWKSVYPQAAIVDYAIQTV